MHVGFNCVFLVPGQTGGMEVYARELIAALRGAAPGARLTAFVNREAAGEDLGVEQVVVPVDATSRVQWVRGEQLLLPRLARECDVVHSLATTAPARGPFRRVVTTHDLLYRTVPEAHFGLRGLGMRVLVPLAARRADRVITAAEAIKDEIVEHLHVPAERVDVVYHGLGRRSDTATPEAELRSRLGLGDREVLLCLSAKRPHKNLEGLLDALALIPPERRPIAVLGGYRTPHEDVLREHSRAIADDVRFEGWLPGPDIEGLFALSRVFAFPSLGEGFGLPVLEAMARGVPVVCSDIPVFREVAGDAAGYFDPHDPAAIARAIQAPPDPAAGVARAARFTWERAAHGTLAAYERALAAAPR